MISKAPAIVVEDVLAHLPVSSIREFRKGALIYGPGTRSERLYVVLAGKVKMSRVSRDGHQIVLDVYRTDDFFGESSLVGHGASEMGTALEPARLMSWTADEIHQIVLKRPDLGFALLQLSIQRSLEFGNRIESFSLEHIESRLISALIHFSEKLGIVSADGGREMISLTHETLSQYVGTSREIITHYMNAFRRKGCLNYSRKSIVVFEGLLRHVDSVAAPPKERMATASTKPIQSWTLGAHRLM